MRAARLPGPGARAAASQGPTLLQALLVGVLVGASVSGVGQLRLAREAAAVAASTPPPPPPTLSPPPRLSPPPPPPPSPSPPPPPPAAVPLPEGPAVLAPASYPRLAPAVSALSAPSVPGLPAACHARAHADMGGVVAGGAPHGDANKTPDAGACCAACSAHSGSPRCNIWVWNNGTGACWLKHAARFPERPYVYFSPDSPWTGGSLFDFGGEYTPTVAAAVGDAEEDGLSAAPVPLPTCIHTVLTSNGNAYMNWQTRVMYATWQAAGVAEGAGGLMTAFTRVLHRATEDELMQEVPTKRFDPARRACDTYCDFPVADRAAALTAWAATPDASTCSHVMMVEADYLFVRAISRTSLPPPGHALGFHFGYIVPDSPTAAPITKKYLPDADPAAVPQTGNAPQLMGGSDFRQLMPAWAAMHARLEADPTAIKEFNWVRDMYSYSFATMERSVVHHVPLVPHNPLMVQPPADVTLGEACILHYTWGPIIHIMDPNGTKTVLWSFDKRSYGGGQGTPGPVPLSKLAAPPPFKEGMRLQANETVTPSGLALMALLVDVFNAAVDSLPLLPRGWDSYEAAAAAAKPRAVAGG